MRTIRRSAVVVAVLFALSIPLAAWIATSGRYGYDHRASYDISFADPRTRVIPAEITGRELSVPAFDAASETAILKIRVDSTLAGRFLAPEIVLGAAGVVQRITLEKGARGSRYLPIDHRLSAARTIDIDAHRVGIDARVEWLAFRRVPLGSGRILIVAPHPDDAEIASYGLYSQHPRDVFIVTVTAGQQGEQIFAALESDGERHSYLKGRARAWNSATTPLLAGVRSEHLLSLGFFDGTLARLHARPGELFADGHRYTPASFQTFNVDPIIDVSGVENRWTDLVDAMTRLLDALQPVVIVAPHPELDTHDDHRFSTQAVLEALRKTRTPLSGDLLLYVNHFPHNGAFPYGAAFTSTIIPPVTDPSLRVYNVQHVDLDSEGVQQKVIGLESMFDMRQSAYGFERQGLWLRIKEALTMRSPSGGYLRKAAKTQEVFFGYPYEFLAPRRLDTAP